MRKRYELPSKDTTSPYGEQIQTIVNCELDGAGITTFMKNKENELYGKSDSRNYSVYPGDLAYVNKTTAGKNGSTIVGYDTHIMTALNGMPGNYEDPVLSIISAYNNMRFLGVCTGSEIRFDKIPDTRNITTSVISKGVTTITNTGNVTIEAGDYIYMGLPYIDASSLTQISRKRGTPDGRYTPTVFSFSSAGKKNRRSNVTFIMTDASVMTTILDSWTKINTRSIYKYSGGVFAGSNRSGKGIIERNTDKFNSDVGELSATINFTQEMVKMSLIMGVRFLMLLTDSGFTNITGNNGVNSIKSFINRSSTNVIGARNENVVQLVLDFMHAFNLDSRFGTRPSDFRPAVDKFSMDEMMKLGQYMFATPGLETSDGKSFWGDDYGGENYAPYHPSGTKIPNKTTAPYARMGAVATGTISALYNAFKAASEKERDKYVGQSLTRALPGDNFYAHIKA